MPELAELKFTADYINQVSKDTEYLSSSKNPQHKCLDLDIPFNKFKLSANSRGKEIVLEVKDVNSNEVIPIRWTMGMSGYFKLTSTGLEHKHTHMKFHTADGRTLSFVDVRRFGKWKQGVAWNKDRSPDPTYEFDEFKAHIKNNLHRVIFSRPIYETLMDQRFFNGIGNYLRAEILYRIPTLDPSTTGREAIASHPEVLDFCRDMPLLAYKKGGGNIKDWNNPFDSTDETHGNFMICYGRRGMSQLVDKNGRRFWYDSKWDPLIN